jgi:hypothetical protein
MLVVLGVIRHRCWSRPFELFCSVCVVSFPYVSRRRERVAVVVRLKLRLSFLCSPENVLAVARLWLCCHCHMVVLWFSACALVECVPALTWYSV